MLTCKEVSKLVSLALDRRLPLNKRMAVRLHLLVCKMCSRYQQQLKFIHRAARDYYSRLDSDDDRLAVELGSEARKKITDTLRREQ